MKAEYITHYGTDLSAVNAARVSLDKESEWESEGALSEKDVKLISYLAAHGHSSCFEHQGATLRLKVPLFVRSQIHRHRTFSYNEISRRYVKDNLEFYWPDKWRKAAANVKQGSSEEEAVEFTKGDMSDEQCMHNLHATIVDMYYWMIQKYEVCPEQARMILPQNLYTQFYMTGNLRNWIHFLKLRLDKHAQYEVRVIAEQIAQILEPLFPISYKALMNA
jgi:thymidylate synthase (FAD)